MDGIMENKVTTDGGIDQGSMESDYMSEYQLVDESTGLTPREVIRSTHDPADGLNDDLTREFGILRANLIHHLLPDRAPRLLRANYSPN